MKPPVIGKLSVPLVSVAVPITPGVSFRVPSALTKPASSATCVVLPATTGICAVGAGIVFTLVVDAEAALEADDVAAGVAGEVVEQPARAAMTPADASAATMLRVVMRMGNASLSRSPAPAL